MIKNSFLASSTARRCITGLAILGVAAFVASSVFSGCERSPQRVGLSQTTEKNSHCEELLNNALDMLQPERLGISADREDAVELLNQWMAGCAPSEGDVTGNGAAAADRREKLLPPEVLERARTTRFISRDGGYIRDCLQDKRIVDLAGRSADNDLDRAVQLFYYVVRNLQLVHPEEDALPLTPHETLLFGKGTAEDRAWIFANLLRQLRIDSVILRPQPNAADAGTQPANLRWLMGVLLDGEVYLFDPRLGWPVPAADDDSDAILVKTPATLSAAIADDGLLRRLDLDADRKYPLSAGDLAAAKVEVIGDSGFWAGRMKGLQAALSGERAIVIYDGLEDGDSGEGLVTRVAESGSGRWTAADVSVWPYPERQIDGFETRDENQSQKLRVRALPFRAPAPINIVEAEQQAEGQTPQFEVQVGQPQRTQLRTRTAQLLGDYSKAITSYVTVRLSAKDLAPRLPVSPEIRRMHALAAEDASFWIGVCQFELRDFNAATETFRGYLRLYKRGTWTDACLALLAWSLAEQGQRDEAVKALSAISDDDPQHHGYELLIRRWQSQP